MPDWKEKIQTARATGNSAKYADLLRDITSVLRGYMAKRVNSSAEAEDITQETLIAVHNSLHTYNTDRPFKPWLFAIANHKLNDHLRKLYRRSEFECSDSEKIERKAAEAKNVTESRETAEYVREALALLPDKQHRIVRLMKIEGYSAQEVAAQMDMSVSAVKVSAHRAYKALKKHMMRVDMD